ncbi:hypothetical protein HAX54_037139, partial [Datura stramonium]|nr:hypothetical protein [Datura stramonium]
MPIYTGGRKSSTGGENSSSTDWGCYNLGGVSPASCRSGPMKRRLKRRRLPKPVLQLCFAGLNRCFVVVPQ